MIFNTSKDTGIDVESLLLVTDTFHELGNTFHDFIILIYVKIYDDRKYTFDAREKLNEKI